MLRDHEPIAIEQFNGLYDRGDSEDVPLDHFIGCSNCNFIGDSAFGMRGGLDQYQSQAAAQTLSNITVRQIYQYIDSSFVNGFLVLADNGITPGIYHVKAGSSTLILSIAGMTGFGFVQYAGRAYITPYFTTNVGGFSFPLPVASEFLYVYTGSGTARKAGTTKPAGTVTVANGAAGHTDAGLHIFGVVFETDTGYLSNPAALTSFTTGAALSVSFTNIPTGSAEVTKRHLVASKVIIGFNGDVTGYDIFFLPGGTINDNVSTSLANVSFYDQDLIDDATHLFDNYEHPPAGVNLCVYHDRLCMCNIYTGSTAGRSLVAVSFPGEPEAFSQVDGILTMPPNGNPMTNIAILRDVLYGFERNKTAGWVDNGDVPTSWPISEIDSSIGTGAKGIAVTINPGSNSVDYLIIATYTGLVLFNGRYVLPELSWKIANYWTTNVITSGDVLQNVQVAVDMTGFKIYIVGVGPIGTSVKVMYGDFSNGLDPKKIRWTPWNFFSAPVGVALSGVNTVTFLIGGGFVNGLYNINPTKTHDNYWQATGGLPSDLAQTIAMGFSMGYLGG